MRNSMIAIMSGVLFTAGLVVSGMTNPQNVINFLDIFGNWDYNLILVMVGAIVVFSLGYHLYVKKLKKPIYDNKFILPVKKHIDSPLMFGSALFGIGWGIGGICPGPSIVSLVNLSTEAIVFFIAMIFGMQLFQIYNNRKIKK